MSARYFNEVFYAFYGMIKLLHYPLGSQNLDDRIYEILPLEILNGGLCTLATHVTEITA
ncbi:14897_t:CDS:2 [Funneliformis mosseae]|uniref:14897_t:CDS:1 n=1 Tax=Funneliformis mosseae TaxID=27381 RepID=A0A9N9CXU7_FUNMO|nr:14897_t:CDS:2 [Funneliformis mosseae]